MEKWIDGWMDTWINLELDKYELDGYYIMEMDTWIDGINGKMDGWINGCMDG